MVMAQIIKNPAPITSEMESLGISQADLARATGMTRNTMSLSLAGKRNVSIHELIKIAAALNRDWRTLLSVYGIDDPTASDAPRSNDEWRAPLRDLQERIEDLELFSMAVAKLAVPRRRK